MVYCQEGMFNNQQLPYHKKVTKRRKKTLVHNGFASRWSMLVPQFRWIVWRSLGAYLSTNDSTMLRQGSSVRSTLTAAATHSPQSLVQPISLVQSISIVILESMLSMSFLRACWFRLLKSEIALDLSVSVPHKELGCRPTQQSFHKNAMKPEYRTSDVLTQDARCHCVELESSGQIYGGSTWNIR
jgi:hypothetical protein